MCGYSKRASPPVSHSKIMGKKWWKRNKPLNTYPLSEFRFGTWKEREEGHLSGIMHFVYWEASQCCVPGDTFFYLGGIHYQRDPVCYSSLMQLCVRGTHFHLACEPPCGPDLAPCQGPRQTCERMTDRGWIHNLNDHGWREMWRKRREQTPLEGGRRIVTVNVDKDLAEAFCSSWSLFNNSERRIPQCSLPIPNAAAALGKLPSSETQREKDIKWSPLILDWGVQGHHTLWQRIYLWVKSFFPAHFTACVIRTDGQWRAMELFSAWSKLEACLAIARGPSSV